MGHLLQDRVAVITGAGQGIGLEIARVMRAHGAAVVAEIAEAGGTAVPCTESAGSYEGTRAIVESALDAYGGLDVVVNNAAVFRRAFIEHIKHKDGGGARQRTAARGVRKLARADSA